ncbi:DNA-3-methyladenine glycosylase [Shouchella sp. JSM 1781072]|uniref:DNA-3-methyladenine glycosylase n=1 Tax=Bacillaceae TaxID=186817 RepID=UPI0020D1B2AA|nr:DNA-3-methyladenine glycosylase [Alkalihalobacillus sp. LMS6]UTR08115.1 DNA-3-methyladenine glycosylase [Alkalihalobacillus sp. LMS6]
MESKRMDQSFYEQPTLALAKALVGKLLVHTLNGNKLVARITETEAYLGVLDRACHSYGRKRTKRTEILYGEAGHVYTYTMHTHCLLNIVSEGIDQPEAVLIRGVEPIYGVEAMEELRGKFAGDKQFSNGPGKLTKAMGIPMAAYGQSLLTGPLYIADDGQSTSTVIATKRVGIDNTGQAKHFPFRFIQAT